MSKMRTLAAIVAAAGLMSVPFAEAAQGGAGGGGGGGGGAGGGGGGAPAPATPPNGGGGGKPAQCASIAVPGQPGTFIVNCSNKRP